MVADRPFRFGVNLLDLGGRERWTATARRAERLGFDVLLVPDHLGMPAPFPALVAAAAVTSTVRLGTFVLNAAFYHPALLAREVTATDELTGGRLELGLGAGYARDEFDAAGLPFGTGRQRIDHLEATVRRVREALADQGRATPLLLGGNGDRMLRLAARTADIVGFTGAATAADGTLSLIGASALDERVALATAAAGDRATVIEWNVLVQTVENAATSRDRTEAGQRLHQRYAPDLPRAEFDPLPTVLIGSPGEIADQLRATRARWGISYVTVLEPSMEVFAPVIELLRARPG